MSDIQFENDPVAAAEGLIPQTPASKKGSGITSLVMRWNLAKSVLEANIFLIALTALFIFYAAGVWNISNPGHVTTVEEVRNAEWMKRGNLGVPPPTFLPAFK